jgi:hypothetical protein
VGYWQRNVRDRWLEIPHHIRRGVTRLYLVITVPWVAWFGFRVIIALQTRREWLVPDLILSLLLLPIALALLISAIIWVALGFQRSRYAAKRTPWTHPKSPTQSHVPNIPNPLEASDKFYQLLGNAFEQSENGDSGHRLALYRKVRAILTNQIADQGKARAKVEHRALN